MASDEPMVGEYGSDETPQFAGDGVSSSFEEDEEVEQSTEENIDADKEPTEGEKSPIIDDIGGADPDEGEEKEEEEEEEKEDEDAEQSSSENIDAEKEKAEAEKIAALRRIFDSDDEEGEEEESTSENLDTEKEQPEAEKAPFVRRIIDSDGEDEDSAENIDTEKEPSSPEKAPATNRIIDSDEDEDEEQSTVENIETEKEPPEDEQAPATNRIIDSEEDEDGEGNDKREETAKRPLDKDGGNDDSDDGSSDKGDSEDESRRKKFKDDFIYDFDLMMAKKKEESYRRKRRNNTDIINDNDDIIAELISQMKQSADEDFELNKNRKAATCKLRLLPVVETQLRKIDLRESFLDAGVLGVMTDWLTPLSDRSLPNLQVRETMLKLLQEFNIMDVERLKASGIGKAVMYLYKHPKETKENKRRAGILISCWSRPIFSLDSDFHTMSKQEREQRDFDVKKINETKRVRTEPPTPPSTSRKGQEPEKVLRPGDKGWIPRARVPAPSTRDYVVRPKSSVDSEMSRSGSKRAITRLDKHLRNFRERKKLMKTQRAVAISIEGRRMSL